MNLPFSMGIRLRPTYARLGLAAMLWCVANVAFAQTNATEPLVLSSLMEDGVLGAEPIEQASAAQRILRDVQPAAIWDLPAADRYVLLAELDAGKLRVFEQLPGMNLQEVRSFPISIGKQGYGKTVEGDLRTPVGIYRITSTLTDEQLDDFYGRAAYPLNYPNVWDRLNQYTGSGIWLHGEASDKKMRPPRDSDGCIVLSNNAIQEIADYLQPGYTKVVTVPSIDWVSPQQILDARGQLKTAIDGWLTAWRSREHDDYIDYYARDFSDTEKNFQQWDVYKRRVNGAKRFIDVRLSDLGLYAYPGQENLVMAEFYQNYRSDSFRSRGWKRQLWRLDADGQWRILFERGG